MSPVSAASEGDVPLRLLVVLNGSLAAPGHSVGGGDLVMMKFIRLSRLRPDVIIPHSAKGHLRGQGHIYTTLRNLSLSTAGIIGTFLIRITQTLWLSWKHRERYDIVLAASPYAVDVLPVWFWRARRKGAVIYHLIPPRKSVNWSTRIRFGLAALEQRVTLRILHRACDFIVAGNEYTRSQLALRLPGKPMFVLPAGFDAAAVDRVPTVPRNSNLACFIGRLVSQKGIFDLVQVMEGLRDVRPNLRLLIMGTGPEQEALRAEIQRRGLANIELAGFVTEEQKFARLREAAFFFFPSYEEGWGIALAEALYCGCRCICYELPHYRSIFGDYPAYARLGDPEDFRRAVLAADAGGPLPGQQDFIRQYDDPQIVAHLTGCLRSVLNSGAKAPAQSA